MASGDKTYIADKPTLDGVRDKIGSTADTGGTKTAGTVMAKENTILGEVGKIGASNDAGNSSISSTTVSIFGKLNYLVTQVSNYLGSIYSRIGGQNDAENSATSASAHGKLNWFLNLFGKTDDTGGSASAGTIMGKLNAILYAATLKKKTHQAIYTIPADTYVYSGDVLLDVMGQGEFYGMTSSLATRVKVIIDESEEILSIDLSGGSGGGSAIYPMVDLKLTNDATTSGLSSKGLVITFKTRLKVITANTAGRKASGVSEVKIGYALYE